MDNTCENLHCLILAADSESSSDEIDEEMENARFLIFLLIFAAKLRN